MVRVYFEVPFDAAIRGQLDFKDSVYRDQHLGESVNSGLDYWNGLLDWTSGLTIEPKFMMILYVKGTRSMVQVTRCYWSGTWRFNFVHVG